jgi:signal transduction histidine kinase
MSGIFVSYVRENQDVVRRLVEDLQAAGATVWVDWKDLRPGERWADVIRRAISSGDYFLACFSSESCARESSHMNEELQIATEELRRRPLDRVWFVPVKLGSCEIPAYGIGGGETIRSLQWVDLHKDWEDGIRRIISVVRPRSQAAGIPSETFAQFAHDLMHYLQTVLMLSDAASVDRPSQPQLRLAARSVEATTQEIAFATRSLTLVSEVLGGAVGTYKAPISSNRILCEVADTLASQAEMNGLSIHRLRFNSLPELADVDGAQLQLLFYNILANSITYAGDAMLDKPDRRHIEVDAGGSSAHEIRVSITSPGIKIRPTEIPRIFERGFRGEAAREARLEGLGVGLFAAQQIADAHEGRIMYSSPAQGMHRFTVEIPC